jgi:hypothetical protein
VRHNVRCVGQGVGVAQLVAVDVSGEPRSWTELGSDHLPVGGVVEEFLDELTPRWTGPPVADARDDYRDGAVHALVSTLLLFDRTGTAAALPPDPGPEQDHPLSDREPR